MVDTGVPTCYYNQHVPAGAAREQAGISPPKQSSFMRIVADDKISDTIFAFKRGTSNRRYIMKKIVRGSAISLLMSLFVVFMYAQAPTGSTITIASDLQPKFENSLKNTLVNNTPVDDKKLVKTTAIVKSSSAGASRGGFSASAYCLSGRTAMGHGVRRGLIAADPRVLKLGSRVYISAGPWSGTYLVSDTGGAIKGKKIDIWVPNCSEARRFGRRSVDVFSAQ